MDSRSSSSPSSNPAARQGQREDGSFLPELPGYDMIDEVGRGGMGIVYEAYQQSTSRRVAVKFLMERIAASESSRRRFEREVELIARLQHPAVVSVVDSGVHEGRYFYAMDFIEGTPLDEKFPPGQADVRAVLAMLAQVGDAVDYAHQRGVLHRDLKPSNVLIDAQNHPHLLDFGLAKGIDPHSREGVQMTLSEPGHLIGTLGYMSPEQSRGEYEQMSVRSDVYSLGAIAYELITGQLPCGVAGPLAEVLRGIAERDPPKPSTLRREVHADVDAILLKAIEKSPAARYATAADFAADIRRYLSDQPITARPPSTADRVVKWVRRNRTVAFITGVALGLFIAIVGVSFLRVMKQRDLGWAAAFYSQDMLRLLDPSQGTKTMTLMTNMAERASSDLETKLASFPEAQASARLMVGNIFMLLARYDDALAQFDKAAATRRVEFGPDTLEYAEALVSRGRALFYLGRIDESENSYAEALRIRTRLLGTRNEPYAECVHELAAVHRKRHDYERADALSNEALALRLALHGEQSWLVAATRNNLALSRKDQGRCDEAVPDFRSALTTLQGLSKAERKPMFEARTLQNLGDCLLETGEPGEARTVFQQALQLKETWFDEDSVTTAKAMLGLAKADLALCNQGQATLRDEGIMYAERSLDLFRQFGKDEEAKESEDCLTQIKRCGTSAN